MCEGWKAQEREWLTERKGGSRLPKDCSLGLRRALGQRRKKPQQQFREMIWAPGDPSELDEVGVCSVQLHAGVLKMPPAPPKGLVSPDWGGQAAGAGEAVALGATGRGAPTPLALRFPFSPEDRASGPSAQLHLAGQPGGLESHGAPAGA